MKLLGNYGVAGKVTPIPCSRLVFRKANLAKGNFCDVLRELFRGGCAYKGDIVELVFD